MFARKAGWGVALPLAAPPCRGLELLAQYEVELAAALLGRTCRASNP